MKRSTLGNLLLAAIALVLCTAPTPGDVGGCGQKPAELDPGVFFDSKASIDCQRCDECGLEPQSRACGVACRFPQTYPQEFAAGCVPLVHDGEVCLRALLHAGCDDYASYMSDREPSAPSECNFCPEPRP